MDKKILTKAIQQKGLSNSLISIYYNIGRALPFTAQRFPNGRISNWYINQYVEVHQVKPSGKGGRYGDAYGFYFRNGERADASDVPTTCWCKADETEPQHIPNAACGSWILLDILGEPTTEQAKVYGINDILDKGKYQGKTVAEVISIDWKWIKWANQSSQHFHFNIDEVFEERMRTIKILNPNDTMPFGKYKNETIKKIADKDYPYLLWLKENSDDFLINFETINHFT